MVLEDGIITWPKEEFTEEAISQLDSEKCGLLTSRLKNFKDALMTVRQDLDTRKLHIQATTDAVLLKLEWLFFAFLFLANIFFMP